MITQYILLIEEPDEQEDPRDSQEGMRRMQLKADIYDRLEQLTEEYNGEAGLLISVKGS